MKKVSLKILAKQTFFGALVVTAIVLTNACSHKITFLTSSSVPAARGYVEMKKDKNNNNVIKIQLTHLAEVNRLQPAKQTYVVWLLTTDDTMKNIGQIKSSNNRLNATFETVSSFTPKKIIITAEDNASTQYPGSQVILSTDRF